MDDRKVDIQDEKTLIDSRIGVLEEVGVKGIQAIDLLPLLDSELNLEDGNESSVLHHYKTFKEAFPNEFRASLEEIRGFSSRSLFIAGIVVNDPLVYVGFPQRFTNFSEVMATGIFIDCAVRSLNNPNVIVDASKLELKALPVARPDVMVGIFEKTMNVAGSRSKMLRIITRSGIANVFGNTVARVAKKSIDIRYSRDVNSIVDEIKKGQK